MNTIYSQQASSNTQKHQVQILVTCQRLSYNSSSLSQVSKGGEELHCKSFKGLFQLEAHSKWNPATTNRDLGESPSTYPAMADQLQRKPHSPTKRNTQPTASALRRGPS
ncbi:hypothetical protein Nepgr_014745 [Nepenthes gracilis]|uniref:Uncharacterized protein n=1 Tax=Nepenthes gracilis TaxID=150966 RepID=A0AAD3SLN9_NEPGR|nr:hypothetical protein Nepgr_014745 [Nepenthes gracilis]